MNIVFIDSSESNARYLDPLREVGTLACYTRSGASGEEVISLAKDADILIVSPSGIGRLSETIINQLERLKFVAIVTIGSDWVDLDTLKQRNIPISNIKGATAESVAEHAVGMILDLSKRITEFDRDTRFHQAYDFNLYKGQEVFEKTLGIIGLGDIGKRVGELARAFNMKVIGVNKSGKPVEGVELVDLNTLYQQSDIISVNVPLNHETNNLIDESAFSLMKQGVILVNCAREEIVNKDAVIQALESGKVSGYGVETAIMKPLLADDPYFRFNNVIVIPHNGFNTVDADRRTYEMVVENIQAFLSNNPRNLLYEL